MEKIERKEPKKIVIIGMPGAGKTTIGQAVARNAGWKHIDLDEEIIKHAQMEIPKIFEQFGEPHFRAIEKEVMGSFREEENVVISAGGGTIIDPENYPPMGENGRIYQILRPLEELSTDGRPLSAGGMERLQELWRTRKEKYEAFADVQKNNVGIEETGKEIWEEYQEYMK